MVKNRIPEQITKYWIGIRDLDPVKRTLKVDGLHLGLYTLGEYDKIYIDSILSTEIIEGTYCPENKRLIEDIEMHPERYKTLFSSAANLKILNYLELCNRLDTTPYITDYELIHYVDGDRVKSGQYVLVAGKAQKWESVNQKACFERVKHSHGKGIVCTRISQSESGREKQSVSAGRRYYGLHTVYG